jgi:hypothetical protein
VNDFEAVSCGEDSLRPACARNDLSIVLDGDAVTLKTKFGNEVIESGGLWQCCKGAGLAVENER